MLIEVRGDLGRAADSAELRRDVLERLGPYLEPDAVDPETIARLKEAIALVERKTAPRG